LAIGFSAGRFSAPEEVQIFDDPGEELREARLDAEDARFEAAMFESYFAKSQVLLGLVAENEGYWQILRTPEFREKFHPAWFEPAAYTKIIGRNWFFRELVDQKVATHEMMGTNYAFDRCESEDRAQQLLEPALYYQPGRPAPEEEAVSQLESNSSPQKSVAK
jgi:hypothetical protein